MTWSSLKLSLRIAYRDIRATKGRSFLVIMLLGLPVMACTVGAGLIDSFSSTPLQRANYYMGQADAIVSWEFDEPVVQDPLYDGIPPVPANQSGSETVEKSREDILDAFGQGSHLLETTTNVSHVDAPEGPYPLDFKGIDLSDTIATGMLEIVEGTAPGTDEIALSASAATRLHANIGDTLRLRDRDRTVTVTGFVEDPQKTDDLFGVGLPATVGGEHEKWLIDTPDPITWHQVRQYNESGIGVYSKHVANDPPLAPQHFQSDRSHSIKELALTILIASAIIVNVVLMAAPAFAISSRHRGREYALLSANGATPAQIRHTVLAGGLILGMIAAVIGVGLGVVAAYLSMPLAEMFLAQRAWSFGFMPLVTVVIAIAAILVGLISALVPAWKASRNPTLAGLSRNETITRPVKRWVIAGTILIAGGTGTSIAAATSSNIGVFLIGLIAAQLGVALWMPVLVGLIAKLGILLPPALRISLRYISRNRGTAGPALTAITAVIATSVAMAMLTVAEHDRFQARQPQVIPHGTFAANITTPTPDESTQDGSASTEAVTDVTAIAKAKLGLGETYVLHDVSCATGEHPHLCDAEAVAPRAQHCPYGDGSLSTMLTGAEQARAARLPQCSQHEEEDRPWTESLIIDDKDVLAAFTGMRGDELGKAHHVLKEGGAIVPDSKMVSDGAATIRPTGHDLTDQKAPSAQKLPALAHDDLSPGQVLLSTQAAESIGLARSEESLHVIGALQRTPDSTEEQEFHTALRAAGYDDITTPSVGIGNNPDVYWSVVEVEEMPPSSMAQLLMLVLISFGVALLGTVATTALTAAESRTDLRTLAAIGAGPSIRRKLTMCQAGVVSATGTIFGTASGIGVYYLLTWALNASISTQYPLAPSYETNPPWLILGAALMLIPCIAMAGVGLLTRSGLPSEQRRAT